MSEIRIRRAHKLAHAQARAVAEKVAVKLRREFDLDYAWEGDALVFQREGVQGRLQVAKAEILIEAQLGLLLSLWKSRIEEEIHANLEELFSRAERSVASRSKAGRRRA